MKVYHAIIFLFITILISFTNISFAQWEKGILLHGKICTMNAQGEIIPEGRLLVTTDGTLKILAPDDPVPAGYEDAIDIETDGVIYPGLIDLHSHPAYNFLPIWPVPKLYDSRNQWPGDDSYKLLITSRYKYIFSTKVRKGYVGIYSEVKCMAGGGTSLQGLPNISTYNDYMVRNIELKNFDKDRIGANVYKMSRSSSNFESTKANLENDLDAWFYHLAEGTNPNMRQELYDLDDFGFNLEPVIGIHCVALDSSDFVFMETHGMKAVWSPLSNLLLYGNTARMDQAKQAGVLIGLGSDWSPSGSKNILWELKVAALWNRSHYHDIFSPEELVRMVTTNAAEMLKWDDKVGMIGDGMVADIIVTDNKNDDAYVNLLLSTEEDVDLVIIGGVPYYGNKEFMKKLKRHGWSYDFDVIDKKFPGKKAVDITEEGMMDEDFDFVFEFLENEMGSDSFPSGGIPPDPIYTSQDPEFFRLIWSVPHNPLDIMQLANFVHPIGRVTEETPLRESPGSSIDVKMPQGAKVIIVKEASGRRKNWHEVLYKTAEGTVYHGVARKDDIEIVSTPEDFGREFFD